jgi:hypothetical protein
MKPLAQDHNATIELNETMLPSPENLQSHKTNEICHYKIHFQNINSRLSPVIALLV